MRRLCLALLALLAGCSGTTQFPPDQMAPGADLQVQDVAIDLALPDTLQPTPDLVDLFSMDVEAVGDDVFVPCAPGEGCFLDPCSNNEACQSGFCVDHLGTGVCSVSCQEECPPGWQCRPLGGGPDVVYVCISAMTNLCRPCGNANDCKAPGGAEDVCVDYGAEGAFCGGACVDDGDCPWGFSCNDTQSVDGVSTTQCVADAGVCPCTGKSVSLGLWTPCEVTNDAGSCAGKRFCLDTGLAPCDAPEPTVEGCDGLDNDCDGDVDEPGLVDGTLTELCDDQNDCTQDACKGAGGCTHEALSGTECFDGNPCTVADHCEAGSCVGSPVDCDDDNPCTDDSCDETGGCLFVANAAQCDDGDPCTVADQCQDMTCSGYAVDCECLQDSDCEALEDGNVCNGTLVCDTQKLPHLCVVDIQTVVACPEPAGADAPCLMVTCGPDTGACGFAPRPDGIPCNDGDTCTINDSCLEGVCVGGAPAHCDDGNPCTDDSCGPGGVCLHSPNQAPCDDNNACTTGDHCSQGTCLYQELVLCDDEDVCTTDSCSPSGGCSYTLNSAPCDDGDVCTTGDHCHLGACIASGSLTCNDGNGCTDDGCSPDTGCTFLPNQDPCDDGEVCTILDQCQDGQCKGGQLLVCDDDNPCTTDSCHLGQGCQFVPNNLPCDDGDTCTTQDLCQAGACVGGPAPDCDDGNGCTDDSCDAVLGCQNLPNTAPCDDGSVCTTSDTCAGGGCAPGPDLDCDDQIPCTVDACHPQNGCVHGPEDTLCDDQNECTTDLCSAQTGCSHPTVADSTPCGDGSWQCLGGFCKEKLPCHGGWSFQGRCWYQGPVMSENNCPTCDDICSGHGGCHEPSLVTHGKDQSCAACKSTACPGCGCQDGPGNIAAHEAAPMHNSSLCEFTDHPSYPPICGMHHCNSTVWGRRRLCACNETP
jgi:hypothetical protein